MKSGAGLTTGAGCEAILDPPTDTLNYGQYLTTTLENIRIQHNNQRKMSDPNRHSTPQSSRDSMFNTDLTMISKFTHQGITGADDLTQFPQVGQFQAITGGPPHAGPSHAPQGPSTGGLAPDPHDPANLHPPVPPASTPGLLTVPHTGSTPSLPQSQSGHNTISMSQPGPSTTAPIVGPLGPPALGKPFNQGPPMAPIQRPPTVIRSISSDLQLINPLFNQIYSPLLAKVQVPQFLLLTMPQYPAFHMSLLLEFLLLRADLSEVISFHHPIRGMAVLPFLRDHNQEFLHFNFHLQEHSPSTPHGAQFLKVLTQGRDLWKVLVIYTRVKVLLTMVKPNRVLQEEVHQGMVLVFQGTLAQISSRIPSTNTRTTW